MTAQEHGSNASPAPSPLQTYRRLLAYLRPHRGMFALGIVGAMLYSLSMVSFTIFAKYFGDGTFENRDPRTIVALPLALIVLFFLRGLGDFTQTYCMGYVGRHIVKRLQVADLRAGNAIADRLLRPQLHRCLAVAADFQYRAGRTGGHRLGDDFGARDADAVRLHLPAVLSTIRAWR